MIADLITSQAAIDRAACEHDNAAMIDITIRQLRPMRTRPLPVHLTAITFKVARQFVQQYHRHAVPPAGWKFGTGLADEVGLVGVAICGRPVSRCLDDGNTIEITRLCVFDGVANGASKLAAAMCRAARDQGYGRVITYTLASEPGTSLVAAGFDLDAEQTGGGQWNTPSRSRRLRDPDEECIGPRSRWVKWLQ